MGRGVLGAPVLECEARHWPRLASRPTTLGDWDYNGAVNSDDSGMWGGTLGVGDGYDLGFGVVLA